MTGCDALNCAADASMDTTPWSLSQVAAAPAPHRHQHVYFQAGTCRRARKLACFARPSTADAVTGVLRPPFLTITSPCPCALAHSRCYTGTTGFYDTLPSKLSALPHPQPSVLSKQPLPLAYTSTCTKCDCVFYQVKISISSQSHLNLKMCFLGEISCISS